MTSKPNKLVVKRIRLDELYATVVPDRPSDQRLRKSNFSQLPNLSRLEIKKYLNNWDITVRVKQFYNIIHYLCCIAYFAGPCFIFFIIKVEMVMEEHTGICGITFLQWLVVNYLPIIISLFCENHNENGV